VAAWKQALRIGISAPAELLLGGDARREPQLPGIDNCSSSSIELPGLLGARFGHAFRGRDGGTVQNQELFHRDLPRL